MVVEIIPFKASVDRTGVVKVRDSEKKIRTVIGTIEDIAYGDYVEVTGVERHHPHHGLQVRASTIKTTYPTEKESTIEWLIRHLKMSRYNAEGIVVDWLVGYPNDTTSVAARIEGLWVGAAEPLISLRDEIFDVFNAHGLLVEFNLLTTITEKKKVMDELVELGLDTKEAYVLYLERGRRAAEEVREDPYIVYYYVDTVPFDKIDKIYLRRPDTLKTDDRRVRALCLQRVRDFVENGDTAVRYDDLIDMLEEKHDYLTATMLIDNLHTLVPEMLSLYYMEQQGMLVQPKDLAKYEDGFALWLIKGLHPETSVKQREDDTYEF